MHTLTSLKLRMRNHPRMLRWDAVDTSSDLGVKMAPKTFEMANSRTTRMELERVFCRTIYFPLTFKDIFLALAPIASPPPGWVHHCHA